MKGIGEAGGCQRENGPSCKAFQHADRTPTRVPPALPREPQRVAILSASLKKNAISTAAFSSESDAWIAFRPLDSA